MTENESQEKAPKLLTPKQIKENIEAAEKWLKSGHYKGGEVRWKQWEKNKKYLMCVWDEAEKDHVNVNSVFSNFNTVRPTLYFKNPKITAVPAKPEFKRDEFGEVLLENGRPLLVDNYKSAKLLSTKINYELKEIKFKKTLKKVLGDTLCPYGVGWIKWGYSTLTVAGHDNNRDRKVSFWGKRVDPRNLVYDWMATDIDDARFVAERIVLTRKAALDMGFTIPQDYTCELPDFLKDRAEKSKAGNGKKEDDLIIIWEYHALPEQMIYWVLDKYLDGKFQPKEPTEEPYPFDGSSYIPLVLNENNDDIIGLSDVEPIEDAAKAKNRIRTKQVRHVDKFGTTVWYEDGAILPNDLENHVTTDHAVYVKMQQGRLSGIKVEGTPSMGQDNYAMDGVLQEDINNTLGITDYQRGDPKSRTATEGQIVQNAANIRIEERRDVIYDFVIECVRRLVAMIQTFGEEEEFLNIADEDFDEDFVEVLKNDYGFNPKIPFLHMKKKDIQGEYNFEFNVEDMIVRPKEIQLQQLTNLMTVYLGSPMGIQALEDNDVSLAKVVKKSFELAGVDMNELKHTGPQQLSAERENQMFLAGMEVPEPHRKDDDDEHILSHKRTLMEVEAQLQAGMQQAQGLQMQLQELSQFSADPNAQATPETAQLAQQKVQEIQQQLDAMMLEMEPIQNIARKIKLQIQMHEENRQKKDQMKMRRSMSQMTGGMQGEAAQQVQMSQQAQQIQ